VVGDTVTCPSPSIAGAANTVAGNVMNSSTLNIMAAERTKKEFLYAKCVFMFSPFHKLLEEIQNISPVKAGQPNSTETSFS
jgi:hypothetical protein